jgi:uncharacterized protein YjbI with pentapeptide repeats
MADLPHVDLRGANLKGANLRGAMLWGAVLDGACLDDADLTCANLTWSEVCGCSMKGTRLVEADLDEALIDGLADAVNAGAAMFTIGYIANRVEADNRMVEIPPDALEEMERADEAILRAHIKSAPLSLRKRGAARSALCRSDPDFTDDWISFKHRQLDQARTRVLSDSDLQELLRWSASTGKPLNLRGCNLSGAKLRNASLRGACLAFTDATGADIHGVDLAGADLDNSYGWERP